MNLTLHQAAREEMRKAATWYSRRRAGLGDEFLAEAWKTLERIEIEPHRFARLETAKHANLRRALLRRFPYCIVYEIVEDAVRILAVSHARRRPNYWMRRR